MNDSTILNLIGVLFILAGLWVLVVHLHRSRRWIHAIGTVLEIHEKQSRDDGRTTTLYSGSLAYHLPGSSEVLEFRDDVWRSPCPYVVGQEVTILINPQNPKQVCVKHGKVRIIVSIAIIAAGAIALIAANKK